MQQDYKSPLLRPHAGEVDTCANSAGDYTLTPAEVGAKAQAAAEYKIERERRTIVERRAAALEAAIRALPSRPASEITSAAHEFYNFLLS